MLLGVEVALRSGNKTVQVSLVLQGSLMLQPQQSCKVLQETNMHVDQTMAMHEEHCLLGGLALRVNDQGPPPPISHQDGTVH